jgi:hypothetical protein
MGNSNIKSNVIGVQANSFKGFGTVQASLVTGTTLRSPNLKTNALTASAITRNAVASETTSGLANIKLGAHQYIFFGAKQLEASIVPLATKVDTSVKGSIYLSSGSGKLWVFDSDTTATSVSTP